MARPRPAPESRSCRSGGGGERLRSGAIGDLGQQPVAFLRERLDEERFACLVAEGLPELPDGMAQHLLGDERLPPNLADQALLGDDIGRMLGQAGENLQGARLDGNRDVPSFELPQSWAKPQSATKKSGSQEPCRLASGLMNVGWSPWAGTLTGKTTLEDNLRWIGAFLRRVYSRRRKSRFVVMDSRRTVTAARRTVMDSRRTVTAARRTVMDSRRTVTAARRTVMDSRRTVTAARRTVMDSRRTVTAARRTVMDSRRIVTAARRTVMDSRRTVIAARRTVMDSQRTVTVGRLAMEG